MAQIVYTDVADAAGVQGQLFEGIKFWLSQKVPSRRRFVEEVKVGETLQYYRTFIDSFRPMVER